jgi:hypothetical protein
VTTRASRRLEVVIELAVTDDDYYAQVRARLRGEARRTFERAVDDAWRARQAQSRRPALP